MINLSDDFKKYIDYISFLHDLSNDAGVGNQSELIEVLKNDAKELIAKEVIHSNQIAKAEVAVIGDFSSGKSSFINSIIGKNLCPVGAGATTSSITTFNYSDEVKILINGDEISQSEYENLAKHNDPNTKSKAYDIKYFYPFESFRNVVLYDTPGFSNAGNLDNGKSGDTELTMKKAKAVDVLLVVFDINQGSITDELKKRLLEIKNQNKDVYFIAVLNKADTKQPTAREKIKEEIIKNFEFKEIFIYSSTKSDKNEFINEKSKMLSFFNQISKNKDKFIKDRFKNEKQDFNTNLNISLESIIQTIKNNITKNIQNKLYIKNMEKLNFIYETLMNRITDSLDIQDKETARQEGFFSDKIFKTRFYFLDEKRFYTEVEKAINPVAGEILEQNKDINVNTTELKVKIKSNLYNFVSETLNRLNKEFHFEPMQKFITKNDELDYEKNAKIYFRSKMLARKENKYKEIFFLKIKNSVKDYNDSYEKLTTKETNELYKIIDKIVLFQNNNLSYEFKINEFEKIIKDLLKNLDYKIHNKEIARSRAEEICNKIKYYALTNELKINVDNFKRNLIKEYNNISKQNKETFAKFVFDKYIKELKPKFDKS